MDFLLGLVFLVWQVDFGISRLRAVKKWPVDIFEAILYSIK